LSIFNNPAVLCAVVLLAVAHFGFGRMPAFHAALALMLPDNDDAMRLVTVRDLIAGQAWFDPVQHRMRPLEGAAMHWSRFVDAPIAGLILGLRAWWEPAMAERIAVAVWPLLVLAGYLGITAGGIYRLFGFALLHPACLGGPFPDMPATVRAEWLDKVAEATGVWAHLKTGPHVVLGYFCPVLAAACFATYGAVRGPVAERRALGVFAALLWTGVAVALVQIRGVYVGSVCVPFVTGWAVHRLLAAETQPRPALRRASHFIGVTLLLAQAWLLWLPLLWTARPDLRPIDADKSFQSCNLPSGLAAVGRLAPGLVLGPIDLGANLLLHTPHPILAAPYHGNHEGLLAGIEAFGGTEADMKRHVDPWGVDYVAVCPAWLRRAGETPPFARALAEGAEAPWLERVPVQGTPLLVFRVRKG